MYCKTCGTALVNGANFCMECGTKLHATAKFCYKCGKEVKKPGDTTVSYADKETPDSEGYVNAPSDHYDEWLPYVEVNEPVASIDIDIDDINDESTNINYDEFEDYFED